MFTCKDEWKNYLERIQDPKLGDVNKDRSELDRHWVSYRGQTLARTGNWHKLAVFVLTYYFLFQYIYVFFPGPCSKRDDLLQGGFGTSMFFGFC